MDGIDGGYMSGDKFELAQEKWVANPTKSHWEQNALDSDVFRQLVLSELKEILNLRLTIELYKAKLTNTPVSSALSPEMEGLSADQVFNYVCGKFSSIPRILEQYKLFCLDNAEKKAKVRWYQFIQDGIEIFYNYAATANPQLKNNREVVDYKISHPMITKMIEIAGHIQVTAEQISTLHCNYSDVQNDMVKYLENARLLANSTAFYANELYIQQRKNNDDKNNKKKEPVSGASLKNNYFSRNFF
jgi:hypothetical protein